MEELEQLIIMHSAMNLLSALRSCIIHSSATLDDPIEMESVFSGGVGVVSRRQLDPACPPGHTQLSSSGLLTGVPIGEWDG